MAFDTKLLDIVACPICKGKLKYGKEEKILVCSYDRVSYPVKDDIPVLLESEAQQLTLEEIEKWTS